MRFLSTLSLKPLAGLLAASGLLAMALPAHATVVIDGLSASAMAQAGGGAPESNGPINTLPSARASTWTLDTSAADHTSSSQAWSWGHVNGAFAAGSGGSGVFDATALFTRTWNITNTTDTAQRYSFSFLVERGELEAHNGGESGDGRASYLLSIAMGGSSLFSSGATLNSHGELVETGTRLSGAGATAGFGAYSWGDTLLSLDLGVLNPGETQLLSYDLVGHSFGNYGFTERCYEGGGGGGGGGYGEFPVLFSDADVPGGGGLAVGEYCYWSTGVSWARIGDPSNLSGTPLVPPTITAQAVVVNEVPEPGSLALLGLGLTAVVALRHRRRR